MAVSGRKTKSFETSINKGSAEDYDHTCDPCLTVGHCVEAHGYCVECQDYLCIACFRSHSKNRTSKHHQLLDNTASVPRNAPQPAPDTCTEKCPKHGQEIIKFFCPEHEALGCNDCIILEHKTCKIDYIPDKSVGFASRDKNKGTLEELDFVLENVSYVHKMADAKTQEVNQAHKKIEEEVNKFQKEIIDRVAELKKQVMDEADRTRKTKKCEISKVLKTCEKVATDVKRIQLDADNSISAKRDGQAFISVKRAEQLLKSEDMKEAEFALKEIGSYTTFLQNNEIQNMLHGHSVLGNLTRERIPDFVCHNVRDAVTDRSKMRNARYLVCVALEIGFINTGCGFSFEHDYKKDPLKMSTHNWTGSEYTSLKVPTAVLLNPNSTMCAFGQEAIDKYRELADEEKLSYFFLESFMMALYEQTDARETFKDATGKAVPPVQVLSHLIRFLKELVMTRIKNRFQDLIETDCIWTLTVPERFNKAKHVMEDAAQQAGIASNIMTVAYESEAVFSYLQKVPAGGFQNSPGFSIAHLPEGAKYLVLHAEDDVITSTVFEVGNGKSKRLLHAALDSFGDCSVDNEFEKFMARLFGNDVLQRFKKNYMEPFEEMMSTFKIKQRTVSTEQTVTLQMPCKLVEILTESTCKTLKDVVRRQPFTGKITRGGDKIKIDAGIFRNIFKPAIDTIIAHLTFVLHDESALGCDTIVMVGSLAESPILEGGVIKAFPRVIVLKEPGNTVIHGAVILGHSLNK